MFRELFRCYARARSIQRSLQRLDAEPSHILLIAPSTCGALALARALCRRRPCFITSGTITSLPDLRLGPHVRSPADIARAFAGQSALPRSVISLPDQHAGGEAGSVILPFLGARYSFSAFDALLVARHRPPVYALAGASAAGDFTLQPIHYGDLFAPDGRLLSLPGLLRRLFMYLEQELAQPPPDWLASECFRVRSEAVRWLGLREELKDVECLLRMHLQSRYCDRVRTETALSAVVARQKLFAHAIAC